MDDYTGEPVMADMRDLVVTTDASMRPMEDALGVLNIPRGVDTDATRTLVVRPAAGIFSSIIKSDYARKRLTDWYQPADGGSLNATQAATAASNTWLVSDLARSFGWATEWDLETVERSGNEEWEYFNQEIVLLIKYLWKVTPVVKNPRVSVLCVP